jgi:putative hemolysin
LLFFKQWPRRFINKLYVLLFFKQWPRRFINKLFYFFYLFLPLLGILSSSYNIFLKNLSPKIYMVCIKDIAFSNRSNKYCSTEGYRLFHAHFSNRSNKYCSTEGYRLFHAHFSNRSNKYCSTEGCFMLILATEVTSTAQLKAVSCSF